VINSRADLRNPRTIGRLLFGVPSHRPVATGAADELLQEILEERGEPPEFRAHPGL
jgi:hypothetical protein